MPVSQSKKEQAVAVEPGPESPPERAPEIPTGLPSGWPDFLHQAATPARLKDFEGRPADERERLLEAGQRMLRSFEPHVQRWAERVGEVPNHTPFPLPPWPALLRPYALDCISFALLGNPQGCFGRETRCLLKAAVDRCMANGLPSFVKRLNRRSYAGSAVIQEVVLGWWSPLRRTPLEKLLENPDWAVAQAVQLTFDTLAAGQIDLTEPLDEEMILRLQQGLRDQAGDYLRVETAAEIEGWYALLDGSEWGDQLEAGRLRLALLEDDVIRWSAVIGEAPPNHPLAINPWPETVACYAKDVIAFLFRCEATVCLGRRAAHSLDDLVSQMAAQGLPAGLDPVEQAGFARFVIGRYLLGDPGNGAVLNGEAKIDPSAPVASVETALAEVWTGYLGPNGLGTFLATSRQMLTEWRRTHPRRFGPKPPWKRPAIARGGALNAVWGFAPMRRLEPLAESSPRRRREDLAQILASLDDRHGLGLFPTRDLP